MRQNKKAIGKNSSIPFDRNCLVDGFNLNSSLLLTWYRTFAFAACPSCELFKTILIYDLEQELRAMPHCPSLYQYTIIFSIKWLTLSNLASGRKYVDAIMSFIFQRPYHCGMTSPAYDLYSAFFILIPCYDDSAVGTMPRERSPFFFFDHSLCISFISTTVQSVSSTEAESELVGSICWNLFR